ncbi:hypothetical protein M404DRAFT_32396 [Pisolithus tinctorius Marx 270]|uniref:Uncharacterized protein n=1 Tax=Pisolithus tinctorius Marx 270 TaxID=870435 RepID=A0A0C3N8B3_PISTI|nr:hypothetical protein M404DRAFT_32396 [Pisolithus tinctorius Marx 270]
MANEDPSTNYIKKAADTLCFEIEESTSGTRDLLTVKLQETPELERVEPVEEPPMTQVPIEFKLKRSKS